MVCITMDAHGRDVVQKMAREGVTKVRISTVIGKSFTRALSTVAMKTARRYLYPLIQNKQTNMSHCED